MNQITEITAYHRNEQGLIEPRTIMLDGDAPYGSDGDYELLGEVALMGWPHGLCREYSTPASGCAVLVPVVE